ncbi:hypothetical protein V8E36_005499 [Tilletia maclaganii]
MQAIVSFCRPSSPPVRLIPAPPPPLSRSVARFHAYGISAAPPGGPLNHLGPPIPHPASDPEASVNTRLAALQDAGRGPPHPEYAAALRPYLTDGHARVSSSTLFASPSVGGFGLIDPDAMATGLSLSSLP